MIITLFTLLSSFFYSSIFIIIVAILRRRKKFIMDGGLTFLVYLLIASMIRLLCFFELPFTQIIYFPRQIMPFFGILYEPLYFPFNLETTPIAIITFIWLAVGVCILLISFVKYFQFLFFLKKHVTETTNPQITKALITALSTTNKKTKFRIFQDDEILAPMVIGFFKPIILLPSVEFTDEELFTVFLHESSHFHKGDIWIKLIRKIAGAVFWWNPLIYLLKSDQSPILELSCDTYVVTRLQEDQRLSYLESIVKVCRQNNQQKSPVFAVCMAFDSPTSPDDDVQLSPEDTNNPLLERVNLILNYKPLSTKKTFLLKIGYIIIVLSLFIGSFAFVAQPIFDMQTILSQDDISEYPYIFSDNTFIIKNEKGDFKLFVDDKFIDIIPKYLKDELLKNADIHFYTENKEDKIK